MPYTRKHMPPTNTKTSFRVSSIISRSKKLRRELFAKCHRPCICKKCAGAEITASQHFIFEEIQTWTDLPKSGSQQIIYRTKGIERCGASFKRSLKASEYTEAFVLAQMNCAHSSDCIRETDISEASNSITFFPALDIFRCSVLCIIAPQQSKVEKKIANVVTGGCSALALCSPSKLPNVRPGENRESEMKTAAKFLRSNSRNAHAPVVHMFANVFNGVAELNISVLCECFRQNWTIWNEPSAIDEDIVSFYLHHD